MKFIHLSNVRLFAPQKENPFGINFPIEQLEALQHTLKTCKEKGVDALFITGNLFDSAPTTRMLSEVDEMFREVPNTRVFILTGKRDQAREGDAYTTYEWKSNTTVFTGDCIQRVFVRKYNLEVTGIGFSPKTWDKVSVEKMTAGKKGRYQILLLPGMKTGLSEEEMRALKTPFDYIGVGGEDVMFSEVVDRAYAPGDFTPMDFTNQLEHGMIVGDIENPKNGVTAHFEPGDNREFITLRVETNESMTYGDVERETDRIMREYGRRHIYRILITGETSPELYFEKDRLKDLGNVLSVEDNTNRREAIEKLMQAHEGDALGRFIRNMLPDDDQEIRQKAMKYGVEALLKTQGKEE